MSKENTMCWFPFYANDFLGSMDVQLMTLEQVGAYSLLLAWQWNSESGDCRLPNDIDKVSRLARLDLSLPEHQIVRKKFEQQDGWYNGKLLKVYKEQSKKHQKRVDSARKRWDKCDADAMHNSKQEHTESGSSSGSKYTEAFERCWSAYPNTAGSKKKAFDAFRRSGATEQEVLDGIKRYKAHVERERANGFRELKYANGQTWFNQRRWESEYQVDDGISDEERRLRERRMNI